ncbi:MAG TPA: nucleoside-diphosphate sugar epimerase/dehydratase [Xanthobacteraceae bacterium]|jgi:O-antigen biosynthesis protein WbqV|nr:nucleoside-diphosphate sugar epimerase/dehydratase [Xanthobacteraceae bacterium]
MKAFFRNPRRVLIVVHDLTVTALAIVATLYIRFENFSDALNIRFHWLAVFLPCYVVYAGIVYWYFHLYLAKWRFASLPDLRNIFRAVTVLAVSLLVLDYVLLYPGLFGTFFFGKITIALYWFLQMAFLGGPRIAYRLYRLSRTEQQGKSPDAVPTLIAGRAADAEVLLRAIESGAVRNVLPVGILSPSSADQDQELRGVPVRGFLTELESTVLALRADDQRIARLVLTPSALVPELHPETMLMEARRLGLATSRMPSLAAGEEALKLAPVAVEDLLLRPSVHIDYRRLEDFVRGKTVVVTGGGGSIGSEICNRVVNFSAARLLVIENSEPALHAVLESLAEKSSSTIIEGHIADIRDRERIFSLITAFKPNLVFHAAALKHVPILERDWDEGIKTNVFGSVNVADAAINAGADAMVMISTDKAIDPVSVLGATKRLAEMYCQALDAAGQHAGNGSKPQTRMIAVRFGNVLASNGSVVPKFKAQIEAGGPVTVTHPDMVRYFMTIREACDLVVTAASHALGPAHSDTSVYVLNMGQPIKIVDLAERLIRLSGLEPGRDVEIVFTGIRPGERLNEILFASEEGSSDIGIEGVVAAKPVCPPVATIKTWVARLQQDLTAGERAPVYGVLREAVPNFHGGQLHTDEAGRPL